MYQTTSIQKNPSYPARVHAYEAPKWREVLAGIEARLESARARWGGIKDSKKKEQSALFVHQLAGARDQVAEAVRRMPQEVGELYEEDHHRLEQAVAAFDRVEKRLTESSR